MAALKFAYYESTYTGWGLKVLPDDGPLPLAAAAASVENSQAYVPQLIENAGLTKTMSSKELRKSFTPSYFSIEDIVASQTRIPCQTTIPISKFGFLDPSQQSADLPKECNVELPLWAARVMSKHSFMSVKMPKYFEDNYREVLKADPAVVDLNKMGPQFYQAALQICTLPHEDAEEVSEVLPEVLQRRLISMFDSYSLNRDVKSTDERTSTEESKALRLNFMDPLEIEIFENSKDAAEQLDFWMRH